MKPTFARILVFAKAPVAGQVKTRLIPALGPEKAADLHHRLLRRTLETVCAGVYPVELWCSPDTRHPAFSELSAHWPLSLHTQQGADLGARMLHAFESALQRAPFAVLTGSDCPALCAADLCEAVEALHGGADAVLGPARDGGYWLIALRRVHPALFEGIAWGGATVLEETLARLRDLRWSWTLITERADIDRPEDLAALPPRFNAAP